MTQRTLPATVAVPVAAAGQTYNIVTADINDAGLAYLLAYGLKQSAADAAASALAKALDDFRADDDAPEDAASAKAWKAKRETDFNALPDAASRKAGWADVLACKRLSAIKTGSVSERGPIDELGTHIRALCKASIPDWAKRDKANQTATVERIKAGAGADGLPNPNAQRILDEAKRRMAKPDVEVTGL